MLPAGAVLTCRRVAARTRGGIRCFLYDRTTCPPGPEQITMCRAYFTVIGAFVQGRPSRLNGRSVSYIAAAGYCNAGGKKVVPFLLADIGEGISEVTIKEWYVNVGDSVAEFDDVCEVESDKATVTITSRYAGAVIKRHYETGSLARVGSALVDIEVDGHDGTDAAVSAEEQVNTVEEPSGQATAATADCYSAASAENSASDDHISGRVLTTPAVRRIAAENDIDLTNIRGTGRHGRVLKEDLLNLVKSSPEVAVSAASSTPAAFAVTEDFIPLTGYSRTMRNTMEASNKIPTLVLTDEVDLTKLVEIKAQLLPHIKLTLLPFLVKATSLALARHPRINSTASPDFKSYRLNATHNIGVAIDTPLGLAVPNVKDVQTLTVVEVSERLAELRAKADKAKLSPADVTGGTFTLSNLGSIAGSAFQPMILPPEVAIGALGQMKYRPRYDAQDRLVRTPVMGVSWGADHRILDGAAVAKFFKDWKTYVENPSLILAGVGLK